MKREGKHIVLMTVLALVLAPILTVFACPCTSPCTTCDRGERWYSSRAHAPENVRVSSHATGCCAGGDSSQREASEHTRRGEVSDAPCVCTCVIGSTSHENVVLAAQSSVSETYRVSLVATYSATSGVDVLLLESARIFVGHSPPPSRQPVHLVHCRFLC